MAVEDIGLAAPEALNLCLSAKEAIDFLGSPEGDLALAEAVVYLALAPKSNSVYTAYGAVQQRSSTPARSRCRCTCATRPRADEGARLRQGLPLRPRRRRQSSRHGLPARLAQRPQLLPAHAGRAAKSCWPSAWKRFDWHQAGMVITNMVKIAAATRGAWESLHIEISPKLDRACSGDVNRSPMVKTSSFLHDR
jgi:hypothetical protein